MLFVWFRSFGFINLLDILRQCFYNISRLIVCLLTYMENPFDKPIENPIQKYTVDLTERAKSGKIDPVVGRDGEVRRVIQILSRRTKNNPVLLGDPGVGKTAIVEGLAQRIIDGDVPNVLRNKKLLSLDIASLLAGASFRGEFEKRLKAVLETIEKSEGQYVLFIDELHTVVGAGAAEGAVDAGNMLKPALARGLLHAIGATTVREYRQHIEKDPALERRFQPIFVEEPSIEDSVSVLRGIKEKYEVHHGIKISDDALISAVNLSVRYIADRYLPDKAIDLIDEAAASAKIEIDSMPTSLDELKRQITRIDIELAGIKRDNGAKEKESKLKADRDNMQKEFDILEKKWKEQKEIISKLQDARVRLEKKKMDLERAERDVMLNEAAQIKYGDIPAIEKEITSLQKDWEKIPETDRVLREQVTEIDIAQIVAKWTGIPQSRLLTTESQKVAHLGDEMKKRVIGQDEAIDKIVGAIKRSRAGLADENKPIGSFLFLGPTGVGKTETARTLATSLFNDEKNMIRIDMSEYSESHSIARLIGSPPGYVGYEEGGQLTEAVRRKPYSVILLDEIEKAHPQIFNTFLQIFDDGRLTDGKGKTVSFRNTIIIMTSNLGSDAYAVEKYTRKMVELKVLDAVRAFFKPEFINRLDSIVVFNPMNDSMMEKIVKIQITSVAKRLEKNGYRFEASSAIEKYLLTEGFDKLYGARPLKRVINEQILDEVATQIVEEKVKPKDLITADYKNKKVVVEGKRIN